MFNSQRFDFLSEEEVAIVKQGVHEMRDDWRHISTFPIADPSSIHRPNIDMSLIKSAENQYFLGDALYTIDSLTQINWDIQKRLSDKFKFVYDRLLAKLSHQFPNPNYFEGLAKPGFHIFHGQQTQHPFQWHIDTTLAMFRGNVKTENIHSFLCCIESPKDPAGLEYKNTKDWNDLHILESHYVNYKVGDLYTWNGSFIHRMRQFDMDAGESRITIQGHLYVDGNMTWVYW